MPYGVKRGVKAPGEFGIADIFGLALAGSAGIIAALVTDYQQKGEASAIYTINQWVVSLSRMLNLGDVPLWAVIVGIIALGALSTLYFQPITRQGAFAQGFGLLAVLMTAVPADLAGGIEPPLADLPVIEPAAFKQAEAPKILVPSSVAPGQGAALYDVQARTNKYQVKLTIVFPNGVPTDVDTMIRQGTLRGRLHNADTRSTFNLFRSAGGRIDRTSDSIIISAGVPAGRSSAVLWVRVECEGYKIEEQSAQAQLGQPLTWQITMQPSSTPLFVQRLGKSYWF
jgi:hypothetical protein